MGAISGAVVAYSVGEPEFSPVFSLVLFLCFSFLCSVYVN
jgi:hypothetical protein